MNTITSEVMQMYSNIPVCKICIEPITRFICPDCLYKAVQQWMWIFAPSLVGKFEVFHKRFIETVVSEKTTTCVVCKKEYYHIVCSYDYIREVYSWLHELLPKKKLRIFLSMFSLGFERIDRSIRRRRFYSVGETLSPGEAISDIGICEKCGNFSDQLRKNDSNYMVCENCQ